MFPPISFRLCIWGKNAQTSEEVNFSLGILGWCLVLICSTVNIVELFSSVCFVQILKSTRRLTMSRQVKEGLGVYLKCISSTLDGALFLDIVSRDGINWWKERTDRICFGEKIEESYVPLYSFIHTVRCTKSLP